MAKPLARGAAAVRAAQRLQQLGPWEPVLFPCAVAQGWARSGTWTPEFLAAASPELIVKRSTDPRFMYTEAGRADRLTDEPAGQAATEVVSMSTRDFFAACAAQPFPKHRGATGSPADPDAATTGSTADAQSYHYFTARVAEAFPELVPADWAELVMEPELGVPNAAIGYLSVWLGGPGTTTQAHYDVAHNCFVQVGYISVVGAPSLFALLASHLTPYLLLQSARCNNP